MEMQEEEGEILVGGGGLATVQEPRAGNCSWPFLTDE